MADYRIPIYTKYASQIQDTSVVFDEDKATIWAKAYEHYFRGWLTEMKNAAIADVACGGGKLLYFFKRRGYTNLCGVDISPEQVKLARQVTPDVEEGNVLDFLKSRPLSFDCITALDIVEHFRKDEVLRFLELCYDSLRPGGRLILQTPNADSPCGASMAYGDFTHEVCFTPNAILRLVSMCGFRKLEAREQGPLPWNYSVASSVRYVVWQIIRAMLTMWNLVETGGPGSGVFTRVFLVSGIK